MQRPRYRVMLELREAGYTCRVTVSRARPIKDVRLGVTTMRGVWRSLYPPRTPAERPACPHRELQFIADDAAPGVAPALDLRCDWNVLHRRSSCELTWNHEGLFARSLAGSAHPHHRMRTRLTFYRGEMVLCTGRRGNERGVRGYCSVDERRSATIFCGFTAARLTAPCMRGQVGAPAHPHNQLRLLFDVSPTARVRRRAACVG